MRFLNESMQAVAILVCEKHVSAILEKLKSSPNGNWFVLPSIDSCRMGYWPHVSDSHDGRGCAIFGFVERNALTQQLTELASLNSDGSLCAECVAYEWNVTPSHMTEKAIDPVCGKAVETSDSLFEQYQGELFFFCSVGCRDTFHQDPQRSRSARETATTATAPQR